jgi:hypothetical protein
MLDPKGRMNRKCDVRKNKYELKPMNMNWDLGE